MSLVKNILIVTPLYPPDIGGPATYVSLLEKFLDKNLYDFKIFKFSEVKKFPYIIRHIVMFFKLLPLVKRSDVVYALDPLGVGLPSAIAAKILGKKFIIRIAGDRAWETLAQSGEGSFESLDTFSKKRFVFSLLFFLKLGQGFCAFLADRIVVPSKYLKMIVSNWGINEDKIEVVYNAFSDTVVKDQKEELRNKFGLSGEVLFSAGRLEKWKGFNMLVEVVKSIPNVTLLIAGDGPERKSLELRIKNYGLEDKVKLLGGLDHQKLMEYIKSADLFVLNTGYEGLSHVLIEVMSLGTPIITTNVGGNPELIQDNCTGLLVGYNQKQGIKIAIERLLLDNVLSLKLSFNAKKKANEFSKENMLNGLTKILSI